MSGYELAQVPLIARHFEVPTQILAIRGLNQRHLEDHALIIQDSRYWGRIKAYVMFAFSSKYALALYEAVCLRGNLRVNEQRFGVDEFRALVGIEPGKLPLFKSLKQRVLDPAVLEVNPLSDFKVEIEPLRDGGLQRGPLKGFVLRWEKKSSEEWHGALDELMRPRVGRVARMQGKVVETVL